MPVAVHYLSEHFTRFFNRLNPSVSFEQTASSEHNAIRSLIEDPYGPASSLRPITFLQGSYRQDTAIDTINDIDIVVLCRELSIGGGEGRGGRSWFRNEIFDTIAAPLLRHWQYWEKVRYTDSSMCIKVDLAIKIEILPVVFNRGVSNLDYEPFALFRPHTSLWEDGYARYHQSYLTEKNRRTGGNFKPMIKVIKHLRSIWRAEAVSFHLECLLYNLPDNVFFGSPADYIPSVLWAIYEKTENWYGQRVMTPCGERDIFVPHEWARDCWQSFFAFNELWTAKALAARDAAARGVAIAKWQQLLGDAYFPSYS
jgi:hypothetical protein